jgi:hypothetical protein
MQLSFSERYVTTHAEYIILRIIKAPTATMTLAERLYNKGWSHEEIERVMTHFRREPKPWLFYLEYWVLLVSMMISIVVVTQFFLPVMQVLSFPVTLFILSLIGSLFGVLFGHVMHDLDHLHHTHHAVFLVVALCTVAGSSWIVLHNGVLAREEVLSGFVFAVMFCVFYGYYWWRS